MRRNKINLKIKIQNDNPKSKILNEILDEVLSGKTINLSQTKKLTEIREDSQLYSLFNCAYRIRKRFRGRKVELCAITNARSGACLEDCAFCSQSSFHKTRVPVYPLLEEKEIYHRAKRAQEMGVGYFCIVTSGRSIKDKKDFLKICRVISKIRSKLKLHVDGSLGELNLAQSKELKDAGLFRYNHNLETAQSFYPAVCATHNYADRLKTIENVKRAHLELCCGGIFGMGETWAQRLELFFALKALSPECIPVNFLNPIPGTRLERKMPLMPLEFLKIVAILRFIFPRQEIKVCGGREANLRSLQPFLFLAGADSIILGDYLTTKGNPPRDDLQMVRDLGLTAGNAFKPLPKNN